MNEGLTSILAVVAIGTLSACFVGEWIGKSKGYKEGYDQALHDCQQNKFESDTTITFKPIEQ